MRVELRDSQDNLFAEYEAQRAIGDRVWCYTCCFPGGPWLNRLLGEELLRPALIGWGIARYDLDGFLHWGFNHYREGIEDYELLRRLRERNPKRAAAVTAQALLRFDRYVRMPRAFRRARLALLQALEV
jgi:hypothetical protein